MTALFVKIVKDENTNHYFQCQNMEDFDLYMDMAKEKGWEISHKLVSVEDLFKDECVKTVHVLDVHNREDVQPLDAFVNSYIDRVLDVCDGNKAEASRLLGVNRGMIYRKLPI